jgi:DeoR family transcriptional regulator of aga operon
VEEKMKIAQIALQFIEDEEAIIIGSGTTVVSFASAIPKNKKLTVLTAAMNVTLALIDAPDIEIVQLGGVVRKSSSSVVGHFAEEMMMHFACAKLFFKCGRYQHRPWFDNFTYDGGPPQLSNDQ